MASEVNNVINPVYLVDKLFAILIREQGGLFTHLREMKSTLKGATLTCTIETRWLKQLQHNHFKRWGGERRVREARAEE
jgi:hypothetical protein